MVIFTPNGFYYNRRLRVSNSATGGDYFWRFEFQHLRRLLHLTFFTPVDGFDTRRFFLYLMDFLVLTVFLNSTICNWKFLHPTTASTPEGNLHMMGLQTRRRFLYPTVSVHSMVFLQPTAFTLGFCYTRRITLHLTEFLYPTRNPHEGFSTPGGFWYPTGLYMRRRWNFVTRWFLHLTFSTPNSLNYTLRVIRWFFYTWWVLHSTDIYTWRDSTLDGFLQVTSFYIRRVLTF